jgi:hypothetical protein
MNVKKIAAVIASISAAGTAILGSTAFSDDRTVTGIALACVAIAQLLTHVVSSDTNESLHNGTFQKLIKSALIELAKEHNGVPLEIKKEGNSDGGQGL